MKVSHFIWVIIFSIAGIKSVFCQTRFNSDSAAYNYILDYDVPESPAFIALGITPAKVFRGSVAKPIVVNILNQIGTNQRLQTGTAIDFNPYFNFGGSIENIREYRNSFLKRLAANTQLSFATIQNSSDTNSLLFGLGVRATLFDEHDLLYNESISRDIGATLANSAAPLSQKELEKLSDDEVGTVANPTPGLQSAYRKAEERVRKKMGGALSIGYGLAGKLNSSVLSSDSVTNTIHQVWLSGRYSFGNGLDLLGVYQGKFPFMKQSEHRVGISVRGHFQKASLAGEIVYSSLTNKVEIGGNVEVRLISRLSALVAITSENVGEQVSLPRLRLNTTLRWNMSE